MIAVRLSYADGKPPHHGTGFLVQLAPPFEGGPVRVGVATAHHVLRSQTDLPSIHLFVNGERWWSTQLTARVFLNGDAGDDWAILEVGESPEELSTAIGGKEVEYAKLRPPTGADAGNGFRTEGFPETARWYPERGIVDSVEAMDGQKRPTLFLHGSGAVPAPAGFSGAPIIAPDGFTIGLIRQGSQPQQGLNRYTGLSSETLLQEARLAGGPLILNPTSSAPPANATFSSFARWLLSNHPFAFGISFAYLVLFVAFVAVPVAEAASEARTLQQAGKVLGFVGTVPVGLALTNVWRRLAGLFGRRRAHLAAIAFVAGLSAIAAGAILTMRLFVRAEFNYAAVASADGMQPGRHRFVPKGRFAVAPAVGLCDGAVEVPECLADRTSSACLDALTRRGCEKGGLCVATAEATWIEEIDAAFVQASRRLGCSCVHTKFGSFLSKECASVPRKLSPQAILDAALQSRKEKSIPCKEFCAPEDKELALPADADRWTHATVICRRESETRVCLDLMPFDSEKEPREYLIPANIPVQQEHRKLSLYADGCISLDEFPAPLFGAKLTSAASASDALTAMGASDWVVHRTCAPTQIVGNPDRPFRLPPRPNWISLVLGSSGWTTTFATQGDPDYSRIAVQLCRPAKRLDCPGWSVVGDESSQAPTVWVRGVAAQQDCKDERDEKRPLAQTDGVYRETGCTSPAPPPPSPTTPSPQATRPSIPPSARPTEPCQNLVKAVCAKLGCQRPYRLVIEENGAVQLIDMDGGMKPTSTATCKTRFDQTYNR